MSPRETISRPLCYIILRDISFASYWDIESFSPVLKEARLNIVFHLPIDIVEQRVLGNNGLEEQRIAEINILYALTSQLARRLNVGFMFL
jgi:hypothetical protein